MKRFKFLQLYIAAVLITAIISCSKEGTYNLSETPPLDFRSYYNGLTVTFANATEGATGISWDFGDKTPAVEGDSVVHTYASTGNYVITLKGTLDGIAYVFHTILRVDKPSVVSLTDNSFADWDEVLYPDFILEGKEHMIGGKVDYDANSVYFYIVWETAGTNDLATLDGAVMDLYIDNDNSLATGFSSSIGAELLFEGNIPTGWTDFYRFTGAAQGDWSWETITLENAIKLGHGETVGDTVKMEFAISRDAFSISRDAFAFRLELYYSDWSALAGSLAKDNEDRIVMMMNKQ